MARPAQVADGISFFLNYCLTEMKAGATIKDVNNFVSISGYYIVTDVPDEGTVQYSGNCTFFSGEDLEKAQGIPLMTINAGDTTNTITFMPMNQGDKLDFKISTSGTNIRWIYANSSPETSGFGYNNQIYSAVTALGIDYTANPPTLIYSQLGKSMRYPTQPILGNVGITAGNSYRQGGPNAPSYPKNMEPGTVFVLPDIQDFTDLEEIKDVGDLNIFLNFVYNDYGDIYETELVINTEIATDLPDGLLLPDGSYTGEDTTDPTEPTDETGNCGGCGNCGGDVNVDVTVDATFDYGEVISPTELQGILNGETYDLDEIPTLSSEFLESLPLESLELPSETLSASLLQAGAGVINESYNFYSSLGLMPTFVATAVIIAIIRMLRGG